MPFQIVSTATTVTGELSGATIPFQSKVANTLIPIGDIQVEITLSPGRGLWDDYGINPMPYILLIQNSEETPVRAPINVDVGPFDPALAEYVPGSAESPDNRLDHLVYDSSSGMLIFDLGKDIEPGGGLATVTFDMRKPIPVSVEAAIAEPG